MIRKIFIAIIIVILTVVTVRFIKERRAEKLVDNDVPEVTDVKNDNDESREGLTPGDYNFSLKHDGITRTYSVHVPDGYNMANATPLVMNFHGGGGNADNQINTSLMNDKSDEAGFIVVYPEGIGEEGKPDNKTFNAGNCCGEARDTDNDDIGFVKAMLADLKVKFNIDTKRIYSTGYSNGAMLSQLLACEMSEEIAAIASIAGNLQVSECNPARPVSVLEFHGTADRSVKYAGGTCGIAATGQSYDCKPVETNMAQWATRNSCNTTPKTTYTNGDVTCKTYSGCSEGAEVVLCTVTDGGHTWPGGAYYPDKPIFQKIVGNLTQDISANDTMWEFFEKHPLP